MSCDAWNKKTSVNELIPEMKRQALSEELLHSLNLIFAKTLKNILWVWFILGSVYKFLDCTNSWFSLSDDFPSRDSIVLQKFSDMFHKSFHLSPHVMLSVLKLWAFSHLAVCQPRCMAWLHPTLTPVAYSAAIPFQGGSLWLHASGKSAVLSLQPFSGMLWQ